MKAKIVLFIQVRISVFLFIKILFLLINELLNSQRRHFFQLFLVCVLHGVTLLLKQVNEVHDLLFTQLEVGYLFLERRAQVVKFVVLA